MAKLSLMFENRNLNEFSLTRGITTIGRLPDNSIQVDNPAVSGHHARIYWELGQFILEDHDSLNGTYVNDRRVKKQLSRTPTAFWLENIPSFLTPSPTSRWPRVPAAQPGRRCRGWTAPPCSTRRKRAS